MYPQSTTSSTNARRRPRTVSHHGCMHGGLDKGLVRLTIQDIFLEIEMRRQFLTHDAYGQLTERNGNARQCGVIERPTSVSARLNCK